MGSKIKLSKKVKIEKAKKICKLYSEGKYTIAACCEVEGINYNTFQGWAQSNLSEEDIKNGKYRRGFVQEVQELYKSALRENETNYKALLKDVAREGLLKRANGISYVETHSRANFDNHGNRIGTMIYKIEKYLPPDVTLLIFLSKCLALFDSRDENKELICSLKNQYQHLTIEELRTKRLELERELAND
jgi:hypothetical protein